MRRRWVIGLLAGCCLAALLAVLALTGEREPQYQGKTLTEWLVVERTAAKGSQPAEMAIHEIGTNALPWLLRWLRNDDSGLTTKIYCFMARLPAPWRIKPIEQALNPYRADRPAYMAMTGFRILGPKAGPAIPQLQRLIADAKPTRKNRPLILACLSSIGADARRVLEEYTRSSDPDLAYEARVAFATILDDSDRATLRALKQRLMNPPDPPYDPQSPPEVRIWTNRNLKAKL
jgi:hypothetical protein